MLKKILRKCKKIVIKPKFFIQSYSQYGEDLILASFLSNTSNGFYIDVGAHHPLRFSNTQYFYERGWKGINIDAMPGSMIPFKKHRTNDINLECGVDKTEGILDFYVFNEPALNGFSKELSEERDTTCKQYYIQKTIPVIVKTLEQILDLHLPQNTIIDFLSIDAEGLDERVLHSNNWNKYRPRFVLIEMLDKNGIDINAHATTKFMQARQYTPVSITFNSVLFQDKL